jgi:hypothetical protein
VNRTQLETALRSTTRDMEARQLAIRAYNRMVSGTTQAGRLLSQAWEENARLMKDPSSPARARRAQLAQQAYDARVSAEVGKMMAAYALMAEREGNEAQTAREAAASVREASQQKVLIENSKNAHLRRNIMVQAAMAAERAFAVAPALPPSLVGRSAVNQDVAVNHTTAWRPASWVRRMNNFFPSDIQAAAGAAGAINGLGDEALAAGDNDLEPNRWWSTALGCMDEGAAKVRNEAVAQAEKVASQLPSTAGLAQQAQAMASELNSAQVQTQREVAKARSGSILPWLAAGVGVYILWRNAR